MKKLALILSQLQTPLIAFQARWNAEKITSYSIHGIHAPTRQTASAYAGVCNWLILILAFLSLGAGFPSSKERANATIIRNNGSDTLFKGAAALAKEYMKMNSRVAFKRRTILGSTVPSLQDVIVEVSSGGSGSGIASLINQHVDIANTSRPAHPYELRLMAKRSKESLVVHQVAWDGLAIIVHPNNPLSGLTLEQLAKIYQENGRIKTWANLGLMVPNCAEQRIHQVGRTNHSGTYAFFSSQIMGKKNNVQSDLESFGSTQTVVETVSSNPCAIGYTGMAYTAGVAQVKVLCLSAALGKPCLFPTIENTLDKSYPLIRPLNMLTLGQPKGAVQSYLNWVLGPEGQKVLRQEGYTPVNP